MSSRDPVGTIYGTPAVVKLAQEVEKRYSVNIKWWLNMLAIDGEPAELALHFTVTGTIADELPEGSLRRRFVVYNAEPYAIGEAMRYCLVYIESILARVGT